MLGGCEAWHKEAEAPGRWDTGGKVGVVAESQRQWTGVAVLGDGRMFVSYPRWSASVPMSLAEVKGNGWVAAYPDAKWNSYVAGKSDPGGTFVCVQSVVRGPGGRLYVLDPASPNMEGVVAGGAKLVVIDAGRNEVVRVYKFDESVAPGKSYLNDVRFDPSGKWAIMTDSGLGALVVMELESGRARRVLEGHASTKAEETEVVIDGKPVRMKGKKPVINSDGLAVDGKNGWVYWQALTGRTLYRVPVDVLTRGSESEIEAKVAKMGEVGPSDGLECDEEGAVYLTSVEEHAVRRWREGKGIEVVAGGSEFRWPDSMSWGADGALYVACSQIHLGEKPGTPYVVVKIPAGVVGGGGR